MSILRFKFWKFKSDFYPQKTVQKIRDGKGVSAPQKLSDFFKKNGIKIQWFELLKHEKYVKSKNDIKRHLGAFNQEL